MATSKIKRPSTGHIAPFGLRLQPELKARAEESAARHGRSLNAEIAHVLHEYYERQSISDADAENAEDGPGIYFEYDPRSGELIEKLSRSLDENAQMRLLLNKHLELLGKMAGENLEKIVIGDVEYSKKNGPKRTAPISEEERIPKPVSSPAAIPAMPNIHRIKRTIKPKG